MKPSAELPLPAPGAPGGGPTAPPPAADDTGSRALSEALRVSFVILRVILMALVVVFLASGFFRLKSQENAVILRFGKPLGEGERALLGPGAHWSFPEPIDKVERISVSGVQLASSSIGWYATTPEMEAAKVEPPPPQSLSPERDSYVLTGDANIVHVRAILRYRITDPLRNVFDFVNAREFVTNALNNALYWAAAQMYVDGVLRTNVTLFREKVLERVTQLADRQQLGITVEQCDVRDLIPPRQLKEQFKAVVDAGLTQDTAQKVALKEANTALSNARADARARINAGETDRNGLVKSVQADAQRFSDLLPEYLANSNLFVQLRQSETLQRVMTNVQDKIFLPSRADGKPRELRLLLNREPVKPSVEVIKTSEH